MAFSLLFLETLFDVNQSEASKSASQWELDRYKNSKLGNEDNPGAP